MTILTKNVKIFQTKNFAIICYNEIKRLLKETEKLQNENEKLKEELKENKISLKNRIKEKNLFIRLKNEWEYQNKILDKIPDEIIEIAKIKVESTKNNNYELEL